MNIELIPGLHCVAAAIVPDPLTPAQRDTLCSLLPTGVGMRLDLAKKLRVWAVFACADWSYDPVRRQRVKVSAKLSAESRK